MTVALDRNVIYPDGRRFLSTVELAAWAEKEAERAEQEKLRAEQEKLRAEREKQRAESAEAENDRLRALLAEAGIDV